MARGGLNVFVKKFSRGLQFDSEVYVKGGPSAKKQLSSKVSLESKF